MVALRYAAEGLHTRELRPDRRRIRHDQDTGFGRRGGVVEHRRRGGRILIHGARRVPRVPETEMKNAHG